MVAKRKANGQNFKRELDSMHRQSKKQKQLAYLKNNEKEKQEKWRKRNGSVGWNLSTFICKEFKGIEASISNRS